MLLSLGLHEIYLERKKNILKRKVAIPKKRLVKLLITNRKQKNKQTKILKIARAGEVALKIKTCKNQD